jgi:hypothetical protein
VVRRGAATVQAAHSDPAIIARVNADRNATHADALRTDAAVIAVQIHVNNAQNSATQARNAANATHLAGMPHRGLGPGATYQGSLRQ